MRPDQTLDLPEPSASIEFLYGTAVSDVAAREFAQELYGQLQAGSPLGEAVMRARQAAARQLDDPT